MRNLLKLSEMKGKILALGLLACSCFSVIQAKNNVPEEQLDTLSFIEMINTVELGEYSGFIQQFQDKEAQTKLVPKFGTDKNGKKNKDGCEVEYYRNKEVIVVTIPAANLFAPNETLLNDKAAEFLTPFKRYLRHPDNYRVLLVMHTDNTGSPQYREDITEERVESIFEWFYDQGCDTSYLFPYAMADDMPIRKNDSQDNRNANRRLEIFLMPGEKMLEQAKKGRIEF